MTRTDDLLIPQGVTWAYSWPILDQEGEPMDLTGWTVHAQVRPVPSSSVVLHEWSTDDETARTTDEAVTLTLTAAESSAWQWITGHYDVELTDTVGTVYRICQGRITVSRGVTR